jgi:hypothetical protein
MSDLGFSSKQDFCKDWSEKSAEMLNFNPSSRKTSRLIWHDDAPCAALIAGFDYDWMFHDAFPILI